MKAFFLSRLLREKVLLLAFVAAGAVIWLSSVTGRVSLWYDEHRRIAVELDQQRRWLEQRERIENEAVAAVKNLDPARSFNAVRLSAELGNLTAAAGLGANASSEVLPVASTEQFAVNSVRLRITRANWAALKGFYLELAKRAPYFTIEQCVLTAERNNPGGDFNAQFVVAAVEISSRR